MASTQDQSRWKPYPAYKPSGIEWLDRVPDQWKIQPLGIHARMIVPMRDKPPVFDGNIPWIRIEDFDGKFISDSKSDQRVSEEIIRGMHLKIYPVGTVLCSCSCNMGATAIVEQPIISNQTLIGIVPRKEIVSDFIYYLMQVTQQHLTALATGAIQQYLSRNDFQRLRVPIPSSQEQRAIASFLDRQTAKIDELIAQKQKLIELLEEKRTAIISHAVTKGLDPNAPTKDSGIEWLGIIPGHWMIEKIKFAVKFRGGGTPSKDVPDYWDGIIPWVSPKDMKSEIIIDTQDHISEQAVRESSTNLIQPGAVLIVVRSGILRHTIPVAINRCSVALNQDMKALTPNLYLKPDYLKYFILAYQDHLLTLWRKEGTTVESIEQDDLANTSIPIPAVSDQFAIVNYLDEETSRIDPLIAKVREGIEKLTEYRTALISAAVTGKIDVGEGM